MIQEPRCSPTAVFISLLFLACASHCLEHSFQDRDTLQLRSHPPHHQNHGIPFQKHLHLVPYLPTSPCFPSCFRLSLPYLTLQLRIYCNPKLRIYTRPSTPFLTPPPPRSPPASFAEAPFEPLPSAAAAARRAGTQESQYESPHDERSYGPLTQHSGVRVGTSCRHQHVIRIDCARSACRPTPGLSGPARAGLCNALSLQLSQMQSMSLHDVEHYLHGLLRAFDPKSPTLCWTSRSAYRSLSIRGRTSGTPSRTNSTREGLTKRCSG